MILFLSIISEQGKKEKFEGSREALINHFFENKV